MYSLFFITKAKKKKKQLSAFKGKVRKIGQYIFPLHNNINSYKKSNCNKRNWMLAYTYSLKRQQTITLQEHNSISLQLILLCSHSQVSPSRLVPALELIRIPHYILLMLLSAESNSGGGRFSLLVLVRKLCTVCGMCLMLRP